MEAFGLLVILFLVIWTVYVISWLYSRKGKPGYERMEADLDNFTRFYPLEIIDWIVMGNVLYFHFRKKERIKKEEDK